MEQDFTPAHGTKGELGCPFASHGLPTPRSGGAGVDSQGDPVVDPLGKPVSLRNGVAQPPSPDNSAAESGGQSACPIRFLDQHSPEDLAKYFEEHKHELPRSHEVCVRRFQSNAESIRQLDAKYGDLVHMIQGLGIKHQPMLAEKPAPPLESKSNDQPDEGNGDRDQGSVRVHKWAETVSDSHNDEALAFHNKGHHRDNSPEAGVTAPQTKHVENEDAQEDRQARFERPLREVRVGESPSRPWGIPIPAKFLDRLNSFESQPAAAQPPQAAVDPRQNQNTTELHQGHDVAKTQQANNAAVLKDDRKPRRAGKCPFHLANTSPNNVDTNNDESVEAGLSKAAEPGLGPLNGDAVQLDSPDVAPKESHGTIVNRGLLIAPSVRALEGYNIENHGTLVIGYGAALVKEILSQPQS